MMRSGCTEESNSGLVYDNRFSASGLFTDLYSVESSSNVLDILQGSLSYSFYVDSNQKKADKISSWNRSTLNWSLACDKNGVTRDGAIKIVTGTLDKADDEISTIIRTCYAMVLIYASLFGLVAWYVR